MSIQSNFPAIKPTLLLDFANTEQLDPRITFSRASTATYYGTQTAKAEENLLLQSQTFGTTWTGTGVALTENTDTAPDGTATAETLRENSDNSLHALLQTVATSGQVTVSVFAKLGAGSRFLTIGVNNGLTNYASATFNLSLGTNTQTLNAGTYTSPSVTITSVAQGFYRCTLTITTDTVTQVRVGLSSTSTFANVSRGFDSYTGDNTSTLIIWGAQLEQRSAVTAYTPTTTQPITNYIPVLQTAASGVARFDHNPTTFESLGLLIEEQRTNLCLQSEDFSTSWNNTGTTEVTNTIISPDGSLTGDKLVETEATTSHFILGGNAAITSGTVYTLSCFVKAGERTFVQIAGASSSFASAFWATFNLTTGVVSFSAASTTASITSVGNGWFRCVISGSATSTVTTSSLVISVLNSAASTRLPSYTGDGYSGIYIWGAQLEAGAFPTSYIQTVASQVTRAADAASMTGANFSSWYNAAEGTLYAEFQRATPSSNSFVAAISDNTFNQLIAMYTTGAPDIASAVRAGGVSQVGITVLAGTGIANFLYKQTLAYKVNDFATALNSGSVITDTTGTLPSVNRMNIGNFDGNTQFTNGTIRKLAYYPLRVTNANLVALTS